MDCLTPRDIIIHIFMDCNTKLHKYMDKHISIVDRLLFLMDGRDKYPWGLSIGLGKGVIDGMTRTGSIPGGETLVAIRKCENARIDWILDGTGEPFIISKVLSDEDGAVLLNELLAESWEINLLTDDRRVAVVLTKPGKFKVKDGKNEAGEQQYKWIEYTIVEVIVGKLGPKTMACIQHADCVFLATVTEADMTLLEKGQIGTWNLCREDGGLLLMGIAIDEGDPIFNSQAQIQLFTPPKEETQFLDSYRSITPEKRAIVHQLTDSLAKLKP